MFFIINLLIIIKNEVTFLFIISYQKIIKNRVQLYFLLLAANK